MLTSFGALYAGYIDLDHVGYGGTPVDDRWYPNDRLVEVFENARRAEAFMMRYSKEVLGWDGLTATWRW